MCNWFDDIDEFAKNTVKSKGRFVKKKFENYLIS
jgi:hypothetical protein